MEAAKKQPHVRSWFLQKKAEACAREFEQCRQEDREVLLGELAKDDERAESVFAFILVELDRMDSEDKARLLARASISR